MNSNCLEGVRCPKCKVEGPFNIVAEVTVKVFDEGVAEVSGDTDWGDESTIICLGCQHFANVKNFRMAHWPIDKDHPIQQGEWLYFADPDDKEVSGWWEVVSVPDFPVDEDGHSLIDDAYEDLVVSLRNEAGSELEAYPVELSRLSPSVQPQGVQQAATRTLTAFCHQKNGHGTLWIQTIEVLKRDILEEELAHAEAQACRACAVDWYGEGADEDPTMVDGIVCIGLIEGVSNVLHWDDSHMPEG
jgi:hypothetical protein